MLSVNLASADSWNPGANDAVNSLAMQTDGKLIAGGGFYWLAGIASPCYGRLNTDGSADKAFNILDPSYDYSSDLITGVSVQEDGRILLAGKFTFSHWEAQQGVRFSGSIQTVFLNLWFSISSQAVCTPTCCSRMAKFWWVATSPPQGAASELYRQVQCRWVAGYDFQSGERFVIHTRVCRLLL